MSPNEKKTMRLIELLSRRWDGTFAESDNRELEMLLDELGLEGGEALFNASMVHLELSKQVSSNKANQRAMASISAAAQVHEPRHAVASRGRAAANVLSKPWVVAALAASVLIAIGVQYVDWKSPLRTKTASLPRTTNTKLLRPSKPVGNLVSVKQAVWAEGCGLSIGQNIDENRHLELVAGTAQISMAYGADLVLQAPCSVTLVSDRYVRLESGTVTAQVAKWATGFRVSASDLDIVDLGTRFALTKDSNGIVEAHVLEGSVLAEPLRQRRPQQSSTLLKSGEGIRVDGPRSKVDLIDARRQEFVDELESFRPLRPITTIWNTGAGAALGADDPHWYLTSGSKEYGPYPRKATITDGDTRSYQDNKPEISQWISVSAQGYPGVPPESTHTFETKFELNGYDLDTVYIVGYFLVDDAIDELRINGHPVDYTRWVTTWDVFDFKSFHPIEIRDHFVEGENVISIDVFNSPSRPETPNDPNPTALRVEWQAFGCVTD